MSAEAAKAKLLVVDDDNGLRETLTDFFELEGYTIIQAANVAEAQARLKEGEPDLLLLDINMPGMSGLDLLHRIREYAPAPPPFIMMITAYGDPEKYEEAMRLGANDFLHKPLDFNTLKQKLENLS